MRRPSAAAAAFAIVVALAAGVAQAQTILFTYTGLPGAVDQCKWFDDNLNADRSVETLTHQTDLLYNRVALPVDEPVSVTGTATTAEGEGLVDFSLGSRRICTAAEAVYGPTPSPSGSQTPMPAPT
jgi:hypothetical protein